MVITFYNFILLFFVFDLFFLYIYMHCFKTYKNPQLPSTKEIVILKNISKIRDRKKRKAIASKFKTF